MREITEAEAIEYFESRRGTDEPRVLGPAVSDEGEPALLCEARQDYGDHFRTLRGIVFFRNGRRRFHAERDDRHPA